MGSLDIICMLAQIPAPFNTEFNLLFSQSAQKMKKEVFLVWWQYFFFFFTIPECFYSPQAGCHMRVYSSTKSIFNYQN